MGLYIFYKEVALRIKNNQTRHGMKKIVRLFSKFVTMFEKFLSSTLWDDCDF